MDTKNNDEKKLRKSAVKVASAVSEVSQGLKAKEPPKSSTRLKTGSDGVDLDLKEEFEGTDTSKDGYVSRLKTGVVKQDAVSTATLIKTGAKNKGGAVASLGETATMKNSANRLKTDIGAKPKVKAKSKTKQERSKSKKVRNRFLKTTDKVAKGVRRGARASQLFDGEHDGGMDYMKSQAKFLSRKASRKVSGSIMRKPKQAMMNLAKNVLKAIGKKLVSLLVSAGGYMIGIMMPISIILVSVMLVSSIFGGGSSNKTIPKYELNMMVTQKSYDASVDAWKANNPDGLVFGVRGGYGRIEWRAPLSIIQGLSTNLKLDEAEVELLQAFHAAGLFERHVEGEITVPTDTPKLDKDGKQVEDKDGNPVYETKTIKTLSIVNPSYQEYKNWCNANFDTIKSFLSAKKIKHKKDRTSFSKKEVERMDSLYNSENFFYSFSDEFKDYEVSKGSNDTLANVESEHFQILNPFTRSGLRGQCTWYVWGRASEVLGMKLPSYMGNAQNWINSAQGYGYKTGSVPSKNSIMVLSGGNWGHVVYVEGWDGKTITYSEGNYENPMINSGGDAMVAYAREHYAELLHSDTVDYESLLKGGVYQLHGLTVVGYIYLE